MNIAKFVFALCAAFAVTTANADVIATRAQLLTTLGNSAVTQNFETAPAVVGKTTSSYAGVVISGSDGIQYNAPGYYGAPSHELNLLYSVGIFDFTAPVTAFGLDLRAYAGYPTTGDAIIYGADDKTEIARISTFNLSGNGLPVFLGYGAESIGKVVFNIQTGYINFDNLTFGAAANARVPEPGSVGLLLAGLAMMAAVARRRSSARS